MSPYAKTLAARLAAKGYVQSARAVIRRAAPDGVVVIEVNTNRKDERSDVDADPHRED